MGQAFYRKWRPQRWEEVIGQEHIIQTLRNAVKGERVAHAYLLAGPRGTGKTTTARLIAKAVNCLDPDPAQRPCNQCQHCQAVNDGRFMDLIEIDAASNTSVDDVRDLRDKINFAPNEGKFKVYIIDEVHMLSSAAFNALLKTLEEPPPHAIFVLATTEVHKIPATVLSRCQRHEFRRVPTATMVPYLQDLIEGEGIEVEQAALELISRQATGSVRDAISLLDQLASTGESVTLERTRQILGTAKSEAVRLIIGSIVDAKPADGLAVLHQALDGGTDPRQLARQLVDYLRDLLMVKMDNAGLVDAPQELREEMARQARALDVSQMVRAIRSFSQAAASGRTTWQAGLPLELAYIEASGVGGEASMAPPQANNQARTKATTTPSAAAKEPKAANPSEAAVPRQAKPPAPTGELPAAAEEAILSMQQVLEQWREILQAVRKRDPQTQGLLNSCRPLGLQSGALVIGFESDLLREKMEDGSKLDITRQALEDVFGRKVEVRTALTRAWKPGSGESKASGPPMEDDGMVATAVRDLGAQVVDIENLPSDGGPVI
ncbi:MAG: DNA polymerase III subunit gamma/tau [Anaerolineales bacterium]|jgi:DNA polymerase-3 subunit gamma/tau